jgi:hypothetical protein
MTDDYLAAKIHEALQASSQDRQDAQKLLITWAVRDQALLLALTKPHLKAIVAARIEHELRSKKSGGAKQTEFNSGDIDQILASKKPLGDRRAASVPPPKSSQRQANVMKQLAEAFRKKK